MCDTTCVPVWNSQTNNGQFGGVLIDPSHCLFTSHFRPAVGTTLVWKNANGAGRAAKVTKLVKLAATDLAVATVYPPLPRRVRPAKVVKIRYSGEGVIVNQHKQVLPVNISFRTDKDGGGCYRWNVPLRDKDSGSPVLIQRANGITGVVCLASFPTTGAALCLHLDEIRRCLTTN